MRVGQSDTARFFLQTDVWNNGERFLIEDIENYETAFADTHELSEQGSYYRATKEGDFTLGRKAYTYLRSVRAISGVRANIRLITEVKDENTEQQDWIQISNVAVNPSTMSFDENKRLVTIETIVGDFIDEIEARWGDDFDITKNEVDGGAQILNFAQVELTPRRIFRRSRLVQLETEVNFDDDQGSTARAIPISISTPGFTSQSDVVSQLSQFANSSNDTYARLQSGASTFILNAIQDYNFTLRGTVEIEILTEIRDGVMSFDLVRYGNGANLDFIEIIEPLDFIAFTRNNSQGEKLSFDFNNYELEVKQGESIGLMTLSNTRRVQGTARYISTENTSLTVSTDDTFRTTFTKAIRFKDAFKSLIDLATQTTSINVSADKFEDSAGYVDKGEVLLAHGTWIRNMPFVINEEEDDERRVQSNLSMEDLFNGYSIVQPLAYNPLRVNGQPQFNIGLEIDTELNFIGLVLDIPVEPIDTVIDESYYGSVSIGSSNSGDNTEEVNNLYAICGNANWNTFNTRQEAKYEMLTEFRTSAEDIEIIRRQQYEENPDEDHDDQEDWYLLHVIKTHTISGVDYYRLVKWQDLYDSAPRNVYDVDSMHGFKFTPRNLLKGHEYKIKAGLNNSQNDELIFSGSNCDSSPIIEDIPESGNIKHSTLEDPTVELEMVEFNYPIRQSEIMQLNGFTNGISNRFGLVRYIVNGQFQYGRLVEVNTSLEGSFKLIKAIR